MTDDPAEVENARRDFLHAERAYREAADIYAQIMNGALGEPVVPKAAEVVLEEERIRIKNRTALIILELACHTLILVLSLGSIYLTGWMLETLLGPTPRFFNFLPIHWIIDAADLSVIGKFIWETIISFRSRE